MSEQVGFQGRFIYFCLDDLQKDLGSIESEDGQHHLGHVELRLQELVVQLVTVYMSHDGFVKILVNLLFVSFQ
jgi:hypothetical protein